MSFVSALQNVVDIDSLFAASPAWTFAYTIYCYLILFCFFVNGFLAITAYAYFEVELTEHSDPKYERWLGGSSGISWTAMTRLLLRTALTGHSVAEVEVELDDTVASLRSLVQAQASRSLVRFNLLVGGKVLKDHELLQKKQHNSIPGKVAVLPDQKHVFTGSDDGTARLWRLEGGECLQRLEHAAPVSDLSCSPTGGLLLTLSNGRLSVPWQFFFLWPKVTDS
eukprot:g12471.t1